MANDGDWFAPKKIGYGAGLPIAWQGWALLGAYFAVVFGASRLLPAHKLVVVGLVLLATVVLVVLAARHTAGGWRWRSGDDA